MMESDTRLTTIEEEKQTPLSVKPRKNSDFSNSGYGPVGISEFRKESQSPERTNRKDMYVDSEGDDLFTFKRE